MDVTNSSFDVAISMPVQPSPSAEAAPKVEATVGLKPEGSIRSGSAESPESAQITDIGGGITEEILDKIVEQVNKSISSYDREMRISVHEQTGRIMVKVMDIKENRVIREIPPEKVLDAFAHTLELAGILIDKKR